MEKFREEQLKKIKNTKKDYSYDKGEKNMKNKNDNDLGYKIGILIMVILTLGLTISTIVLATRKDDVKPDGTPVNDFNEPIYWHYVDTKTFVGNSNGYIDDNEFHYGIDHKDEVVYTIMNSINIDLPEVIKPSKPNIDLPEVENPIEIVPDNNLPDIISGNGNSGGNGNIIDQGGSGGNDLDLIDQGGSGGNGNIIDQGGSGDNGDITPTLPTLPFLGKVSVNSHGHVLINGNDYNFNPGDIDINWKGIISNWGEGFKNKETLLLTGELELTKNDEAFKNFYISFSLSNGDEEFMNSNYSDWNLKINLVDLDNKEHPQTTFVINFNGYINIAGNKDFYFSWHKSDINNLWEVRTSDWGNTWDNGCDYYVVTNFYFDNSMLNGDFYIYDAQ